MPWPKGRSNPLHKKVDDESLIEAIKTLGVRGAAKKFNIHIANVNRRRRRIEEREGRVVTPPTKGGHVQQLDRHPAVVKLEIQNGHILIGSDAHYWPGIVPTAHNLLIEMAREFKPKAVIMNGDELDFPSISRWSASNWIDWERRPSVADEIENAQAMLSEIEKVSPKARHINPLSNHSARFELRLAQVAPEYANVHGMHLKDHFPKWEPCWACFVNDDMVVKHRFKSGMYAPMNNAKASGRSMFTGHLHSAKIEAFSDYNGTRWGVDVGTMADPYGPQFYQYTELNPLDWRSAICLATIKNGRLLWPELAWISGPNTVQFRGKEWRV